MKIEEAYFKPFSTLTLGERIVIVGWVEFLDYFSYSLALAPFYLLPYLCLVKGRWGLLDALLVAWCVSELIFRVYVHMRVAVDGKYRAKPTLQGAELVAMAKEMFSQMDEPMQFKNWFTLNHSLSVESLDFLMKRIFFEKSDVELSRVEVAQAKEILDMIQPSCIVNDVPFFKQESMWQSVNPVQYEVRSVAVYGIMGAIRTMGAISLGNLGFRWHSLVNGLGYWIHRPLHESSQPPILYFHGIGFGPTQMLPHIRSLHATHPHRTFVIFYLPQIAFSPSSPVATEDDIIAAIDTIFNDNKLSKVSVVGHSFGTLVSMWLAKARPSYLANMTLIDPVCFMAWNASLFNRACHSTPSTMLHHNIRRIISRDHNFALTIARYMYWPTSFHICQTFPCPTSIFIAKYDWVIDAQATYNYLINRKCKLNQTNVNIQMNDIDHLQFMFTPKLLHQINCTS